MIEELPKRIVGEAPRFDLSRRENHGFGYHCHVLVRSNGSYKRAGYAVSLKDGTPYVFEHGGDLLVDIFKMFSCFEYEVGQALEGRLKGVEADMMGIPEDAVPFNIY